jgi:ABC-type branched-subunit amino acid transport system permease subunit
MNAAHLHLIVNHVPILGSAFGLFLLLLSLHPRFGANVRRAALVFFVITGLFAEISVLSGESAHELLHGTPGISMANVEPHEEMAEKTNVVAIITGLAALFVLAMEWLDKRYPKFISWIVYLLAIITFVMMFLTGELGGHIRHPETFSGWTAPAKAHDQETPAPGDTSAVLEHEQEHE